jgi:hypothetical protein
MPSPRTPFAAARWSAGTRVVCPLRVFVRVRVCLGRFGVVCGRAEGMVRAVFERRGGDGRLVSFVIRFFRFSCRRDGL